MNGYSLIAKPFLSVEESAALRELAEACNRVDGIEVKLNWSMMADRNAGRINDICVYADGELAGYMPLDDFGGAYEITALVAPAHRRKGIFRAMFAEALRILRDRGASELLLVNYRASQAGCAIVKRLEIPYQSSEYCMVAEAAEIPPLPATTLLLERVTAASVSELSRMLQLTFEDGRWSETDALLRELANTDKRYYVARRDGEAIGQIGIITTVERVYIRAVGIVPQWRHKGYGRQLLSAMVQMLLKEGRRTFELDVATDNSQALSLYTSCGFRETNIYDYHAVTL